MITVGLFNPGYIANAALVNKIRELSFFSIKNAAFRSRVNPNHIKIIDCNNGEDALNASDTEYTLMLAVGNLIEFKFFDTLFDYLDEHKPDFLGHILETPEIEGTSYFFPHLQSFIIKTELWNNFDKKHFGEEGTVENLQLSKTIRSSDNIHDDYTPKWLSVESDTKSYTGYLSKGYNILNQLGKFRVTAFAFPNEIRDVKTYLYPEQENDFENIFLNGAEVTPKSNLSADQINFFNKTDTNNYIDAVYIYNTDDPKEVYSTNYLLENGLTKESYKKEKLDNLYCIAGGFFACNFLHLSEWNEDTSIIYFDINKKALEFKKYLTEFWDGRDYLGIIKYYLKNVDKFTPIWHGDVTFNEEEVREFEKQKLFYGGESAWLEFWNKYRKLNHEYIELDLISNPDPLLTHMEKNKGQKNLTYVSNIFYSELILRLHNPEYLKQRTDYFATNTKLHSRLMGTKNRFEWIAI